MRSIAWTVAALAITSACSDDSETNGGGDGRSGSGGAAGAAAGGGVGGASSGRAGSNGAGDAGSAGGAGRAGGAGGAAGAAGTGGDEAGAGGTSGTGAGGEDTGGSDAGGEGGEGASSSTGRTLGERVCSPDQFCWYNPLPAGNDIRGMWGFATNDIWAVGSHGTVLHWNGSSWRGVTGSYFHDLRGVWGASPDDVWMVGHYDEVYHWDGRTLSHHPNGPTWSYQVNGSGANDIWAVGSDGMFHYDGRSWSNVPLPDNPSGSVETVWTLSSQNAWAAGGYGTLLNWDGNVWTPRPITNVYDDFTHIWGSGPNDIWLLSDGRLRHYTGTTWPITPYPPTRLLRSMHGSSAEDVWLGGSNGASHREGTTWVHHETPSPLDVSAIFSLGPDNAWCGGQHGALAHFTGGTWQASATVSFEEVSGIQDMWGTAADDVWAVGGLVVGSIRHFDGQTWSYEELGDEEFRAVSGSARDDVWVATYAGALRHFDGNSWSEPFTPTGVNSGTSLFARARDDVWFGAGCQLLHYDGDQWTPVTSNTCTEPTFVSGARTGDLWGFGRTAGSLVRYVNGVFEQVTSPTDRSLYDMHFSSPTEGWAVGDEVAIHFNGSTWRVEAMSDSRLISLRRVWSIAPNDAWAISQTGNVHHWDGKRWTELQSGMSGMTSLWAANTNDLWIGGLFGALVRRKVGP